MAKYGSPEQRAAMEEMEAFHTENGRGDADQGPNGWYDIRSPEGGVIPPAIFILPYAGTEKESTDAPAKVNVPTGWRADLPA